MLAGMGPSEAEGSCIARIAQHFEHGIVLQRHPMQLACMRTDANTAWEEQPLVAKVFDRGPGGPSAFEGGKQQTNGLLDLGIGIEDDGLILCVEQTDRQRHFQRCATGFVENPALQACLQNMELGLRHRSFYYVSSKVNPFDPLFDRYHLPCVFHGSEGDTTPYRTTFLRPSSADDAALDTGRYALRAHGARGLTLMRDTADRPHPLYESTYLCQGS